jgi:hypothetical protein
LLFSHQFFRRAQARHLVSIFFDNAPDCAVQLGIGDMAAVPGQQVLAAINSGDGDVSRIVGAFRGIGPTMIKSWANFSISLLTGQYRNIPQDLQALAGEKRVPGWYFLHHKLGHVQLKVRPARFPPIT